MEKPDFIAHQLNGKRPLLEKLLSEGVRMMLVVIIALGGAYLTLHREITNVEQTFATHELGDVRRCNEQERLRENQQTVLLTLLTLLDVLDDRTRTRLPQSLRQAIFHALGALPDQHKCEQTG